MSTRTLTRAEFEATITDNDIVLVDWWAAWCGPCRQFAPIFEAAAEQHSDIVFGKVDTEAERELAGAAGISSIPTLMAFREGVLVFSQPGALPAAALDQVIEQVKALDMTEVHRQVEAQKALQDKPREISIADLAALPPGATVIDCREPHEYTAGHAPGAVLLPLGLLADQIATLPTSGPVYVICQSGNRSLRATDFLRSHGIEAYSVAGGTSGWRAAGHPVVTGNDPGSPTP